MSVQKDKNIRPKALIAVSLTGFMSFILDDIDILRDMGYDVTVAADNRLGEDYIRGEIARRGANFVDIRMDTKSPVKKINWDCYRNYCRLIHGGGYKAVVCHTPITGLAVRMAAIGTGAKVIYVSHGLSWTHLSDWKTKIKFKPIEFFASCFCDAIITINNEDFEAVKSFNCPNVYKINGVGCDIAGYRDVHVDRIAMRHDLGVPDDKILVLAIGELSERKNHIVIARALASLPDTHRYVYAIAGREIASSGVGKEIQSFCENNGVQLKLLGFRSDIDKLVHCADIGVIPSVREGLGMAGIQQLCAGVPMVGTAVQGIKEYIIDDLTGFTVDEPGDIHGFAAAINRLSDASFRKSMSGNCIRVAEKFSLEQSLASRRKIFAEVFNEAHG